MQARQSCLLVHLMRFLEVPLRSIGSTKVSNGRTSRGNGFLQNGLHGVIEPLTGGGPKAIAVSLWVNSGPEQDFIGVNVSNSGQAMLIKEEWFQPASAVLNELDKGLFVYFQSVGAESALEKRFQFR